MINSLWFFFLFLNDMSKPGEAHYYYGWPSHEPPGVKSAPRRIHWRSLSRRDKALLASILVTGCVFMLSLVTTTFVASRYGTSQNLGDLYKTNCDDMEYVNTVVHLIINVLSSVVLSARNFCAQLLIAPTRAEATRAHERGDWVDIGAPSLRNLFKGRIAIERRLLWAGIVLTSVPLHLLLAYPYRQKGPSLQGILLTDS